MRSRFIVALSVRVCVCVAEGRRTEEIKTTSGWRSVRGERERGEVAKVVTYKYRFSNVLQE